MKLSEIPLDIWEKMSASMIRKLSPNGCSVITGFVAPVNGESAFVVVSVGPTFHTMCISSRGVFSPLEATWPELMEWWLDEMIKRDLDNSETV